MYIVRKQKTQAESAGANDANEQPPLDQETMLNIKGLMDENVFELLDKTEIRLL